MKKQQATRRKDTDGKLSKRRKREILKQRVFRKPPVLGALRKKKLEDIVFGQSPKKREGEALVRQGKKGRGGENPPRFAVLKEKKLLEREKGESREGHRGREQGLWPGMVKALLLKNRGVGL